jgi:hypothetical protein
LALMLRTDTTFPFTLQNDVVAGLHFLDEDRTDVFVDLDPVTHRPVRLRYAEIERTKEGEPTGQRFPTRIELGGYAKVERLWLPHQQSVFRGTLLLRERRLESIAINPRLTSASFAP